MGLFMALMAGFVLSHLAMANPPVRNAMVARLGEKRFQLVYAIVSLGLLIAAVQAYKPLEEVPLWSAGVGALHAMSLVMLFASILFVGSFTPANKALAGVPASERPPVGVLRITRHPMMWAFGLWAVVHFILSGDWPTMILSFGIGFLALVGAALQDGKKRAQLGGSWDRYAAKTSYWPFGAIISGRQPLSALWPGLVPVVGGIGFWLLLTWLHPRLMGAPAVGVWATMP
jgi:uncharacterized membrane protein